MEWNEMYSLKKKRGEKREEEKKRRGRDGETAKRPGCPKKNERMNRNCGDRVGFKMEAKGRETRRDETRRGKAALEEEEEERGEKKKKKRRGGGKLGALVSLERLKVGEHVHG